MTLEPLRAEPDHTAMDDTGEWACSLTALQRTAPERIYLLVSDDVEHFNAPFPRDPHGDEVTWCKDKALPCHVEYVRADLAGPGGVSLAAAVSARKEAQAECERLKSQLARARIELRAELMEQGWRAP